MSAKESRQEVNEQTYLFKRAEEVLGGAEHARIWFKSPKKGLGGRTPMECAETEAGAREVENLLGRIEHGVFS